jgi:hypothetical protein
VRWAGSIRLYPPLLTGHVATERGEHGHDDVTGQVAGRREDVLDTAQKVARRLTLPIFRPLESATAGAFLKPWASLVVRFGGHEAAVTFNTDDSWQPETRAATGATVTDLDPALAPWLRVRLEAADRTLRAHAVDVQSVRTAWEQAELHLVFGERQQAGEAVLRSVDLIRRSGAAGADPAAGHRLAAALEEFGCPAEAEELRSVLDRAG